MTLDVAMPGSNYSIIHSFIHLLSMYLPGWHRPPFHTCLQSRITASLEYPNRDMAHNIVRPSYTLMCYVQQYSP